MVFIHGNPDSSAMWRPVMSRLADRARCIAPNLPGFNGTPAPEGFDFSLDHMASFVDDALAQAGVQGAVTLVVHDFGGPYGLAWAHKHPHRVARLVLQNTLFFSDYRWHAWARVWRTPILGELSMLVMNQFMFGRELRRGSPRLSDQHIRETYANLTPQTRKTVLALYRATTPSKMAGVEGEVFALMSQRPTLVLWGEKDPYIAARYAHRFPTDRIRTFPQAGHWLAIEEPDAYATELRAFLDQTPL